jgi:hypothetical protein
MSQQSDLQVLDREGFIVLPGLLSREKTAEARVAFEKLYEADLASRKELNITDYNHPTGPAGHTILSAASHLMLNVFGRVPVFDELVNQLIQEPRVLSLIHAWAGKNFKIDSCNVRYMTGTYDPPPAHELHRDGPGPWMNLCIMLSDVEPGDNAATAILPGSHRYPSCPRWDVLYSDPFRLKKNPARSGLPVFMKYNFFNNLLKSTLPAATGAFGQSGDAYFMPNGEVWHGRLPNLHGRRTMVCLMGVFPILEENIQKKPPVSPEVIATLPPRLAQAVGGPWELNDLSGSMHEKLTRQRRPPSPFSLFYWATRERQLMEWISDRWTQPTA